MTAQHADPSETSIDPPPRMEAEAAARRSKRFLLLFTLTALAIGLLSIWPAPGGAERRALERLPASERRALYERTLLNLQSACVPNHPEGLERYCHRQALFVLQFAECDTSCMKLAHSIVAPSR